MPFRRRRRQASAHGNAARDLPAALVEDCGQMPAALRWLISQADAGKQLLCPCCRSRRRLPRQQRRRRATSTRAPQRCAGALPDCQVSPHILPAPATYPARVAWAQCASAQATVQTWPGRWAGLPLPRQSGCLTESPPNPHLLAICPACSFSASRLPPQRFLPAGGETGAASC